MNIAQLPRYSKNYLPKSYRYTKEGGISDKQNKKIHEPKAITEEKI